MGHAGPRHIGFVDAGNVRVALWSWNAPLDPEATILLVHGTGFVAAVWEAVAVALSRRFRVFAIDRRGHGLSSKPRRDYHFHNFSDDCVAVIDHLDLERAYAVGHSAGATDLLLAAARRPAAFARIFATWQRELLEHYVAHGFEEVAEGGVTLRCAPSG